MLNALKQHWPEYLIEATCLGLFMVSALLFTLILEHPDSPVVHVIGNPFARRALIGAAMGLTAITLIYSPMGKQSGAHMNPSVTLTFLRLGKIQPWDAAFYMCAQFVGGVAGVIVISLVIRNWVAHPSVNYVATLPGSTGPGIAFLGEVVISFFLMLTVLNVSNNKKISRFTGLFAGALVATYITFEAPLSGMSMNPARTFGSAFVAHQWSSLWVYFIGPPMGMLVASEVYMKIKGRQQVLCAKLHHDNDKRCIFRCNY